MRLFIVTAVLLAASCRAPAAATAEEILGRARAAQGGAAWDAVQTLRSTGSVETGGLSGRFESQEDLRTGAYADRFDLGAISGASGFDGREAWSADSSGLARVEGSEEKTTAAASEAWRRARAGWFPERRPAEVRLAGERTEGGHRFHVLEVRPRDGRAFELWIDGTSFLTDRFVQQEGPDTQTTVLSDYRDVAVPGGAGSIRIPFASRSGNGDPKYDTVTRIESFEVNPALPASAFALPPPPAPDWGIEGARAATVPFALVNGHVYLHVTVNGAGPFRFLFDTGGMNVVSTGLAKALQLPASGALEGRGVGEKSEDIAVTRVGRLGIGPAWLRDQSFFVFPMEEMTRVEGLRIDGLIGYEVFRRFIVRFDYDEGRITLSDPAAWRYAGNGAVLPFVFNDHVPQVEGSIDGIAGRFDIDTGSRSSVDLFAPFVEKHGLAARYDAGEERITGWGVGGPSRSRVARAGELRLGPVAIARPVVELAVTKRGTFASDFVAGNVGSGVLRRFDITFDYAHQQLWLEPNRNAREPDPADRAGLWVNLAPASERPAFEVVEVVAGGPAAAAGLRAGDRIVSVDGRAARELTLAAFRDMLKTRRVGTRIPLRVSSGAGGGDRTVTLVLRDLV